MSSTEAALNLALGSAYYPTSPYPIAYGNQGKTKAQAPPFRLVEGLHFGNGNCVASTCILSSHINEKGRKNPFMGPLVWTSFASLKVVAVGNWQAMLDTGSYPNQPSQTPSLAVVAAGRKAKKIDPLPTSATTGNLKIKETGGKEGKKKVRSSKLSKGKEQYYYKRNRDGSYALAQKIKELEMMDVDDMEHVLDVEEALYYYSLLKSPVYLSIVDRFFMDMYSEFSHPQASASTNSKKRRLGTIQL
ncbi:RAD3-like DNA-binding helicase protein isoform 1 [Hibiscus syriacus]|uniref:RAD3-like DNA-binding helicase protein isoform 1 n=1 Tax=Hibiscus syriacus TaxID=106335 RepID=A0A6A2XTC0_HIBSY|nr:RAD3-like DNA-binding helicase protein isoform 1 [Hibiscus syriacus]